MLRNLQVSVLALLLAAAGCARHTIPPVVLTPQARLGPAEDFGPGIVDVTESDVDLTLDAPAYVVALRVTNELGVQVVAPVSGSPRSKRGTHYFRGGAVSGADTSMRTVSPCDSVGSKAMSVRIVGARFANTSPVGVTARTRSTRKSRSPLTARQ